MKPASPGDRLALASPLYARMIAQDPSLIPWLKTVADAPVSLRSLRAEWRAFATDGSLSQLRQFRRRISLLIAYRSAGDLSTERETTAALTHLAEFCLREITAHALALWKSRRGDPWDDDLDRPARFAVVAMGKMGGEELNFSSDIDLIYVYEGDGHCRLDGRATDYTTVEFFTKVAATITQELSAETPEGFLFRTDTRLRPEGDAGPLVRSTVSLENYYAAAGQTWERLALLKARPVAGDMNIAAELLETLQPFRYPRHPPPSLLAEVAAMKQRNQDAKTPARDGPFNVKLGTGGIREIEFIAQSLQLLHAGRYPFLQTHSTQTALEQLANYDLYPEDDATFLADAYWFLRRVEHRIQMREEAHSHTLPANPGDLAAISASLGFSGADAFLEKLEAVRRRVRALYEDLFAPRERDDELEDWWTFFTTTQTPRTIGEKLRSWINGSVRTEAPPGTAGLADALRIFVCGDASHLVTREQVTHFRHLAKSLGTLMPALARPPVTLRRLSRFASRQGTRNQFLNTCAANPGFLRALALLFDRSAHACDLLCGHPEIFEEVLRTGELRQRKDRAALRAEMARGPRDDEAFARWLALYIRAEQLRYAIGDLFGLLTTEEVEAALSLLADVAVGFVLGRLPGGDRLLAVALGKYGGAELTFGSDLDMMFIADDAAALPPLESAARRLAQILRGDGGIPALAIDTRLRPHGEAGPFVTTMRSLREYHDGGGGAGPSAQFWEKQMLTRARVACGPAALGAAFSQWRDKLLFSGPISDAEVAEIRAMRDRVERERNVCEPPQRAFKTCAGGLVDFEFFVQTMQLLRGWENHALRVTATRALLAQLRGGDVPGELMENYDFLKRLEIAVRRDENKPAAILPAPGSEELEALARWLGFASGDLFWADYVQRLRRTREILDAHPAFRTKVQTFRT